jgi:DNA helicase II / ATP-dependent DNA helicase PcrA
VNIVDKELLAKELNPKQYEAAVSVKGPQLILAGAGSGKTRTITYKIAHLISAYNVDPRRILAVTFTNKAAQEMKLRIGGLVQMKAGLSWMGTFHSICVRFLRRSLSMIPPSQRAFFPFTASFSIYDDSDQKGLIKQILKDSGQEVEAAEVRKLKAYISGCKNKKISPEQALEEADYFAKERMARLYGAYQQRLKENNAMDFDDLLYNAVAVLESNSEIRARFVRQFQFVFVDEYQDTNPIQYELLKMMIGEHQNITVVGDDDQSIYGWRGADIGIIRNFTVDFTNVRIVKLEQNYRSTSTIVKAAGSVIKNNLRPADMIKEVFSTKEDGEPVRILSVADEREEARQIATRIAALGESRYEDVAVFYRTNAQSRVLEEQMNRSRIPCTIIGGVRFYDRKEIKDVFAYLRLLVNPGDEVCLRRIINVPRRGIGDASVERLHAHARDCGIPLHSILPKAPEYLSSGPASKVVRFNAMIEQLRATAATDPLSILVERVLEVTEYKKSLIDEGSEESEERLQNLDELINGVVDYEQQNENASLEDYLQDMALLTDADIKSARPVGVKLMTMHAAKGLEFPVVHLAGCDEGIFPLRRHPDSEMDEISQIEEERRLFYVGVTRAEQELYLYTATYRKMYGRDERYRASRFIAEIDEDVVERIGGQVEGDSFANERHSYGGAGYSGGFKKSSPDDFINKWNQQKAWSTGAKTTKPATKASIHSVPESNCDLDSQENLYLDVGRIVRHAKFGKGKVLSCTGQDEKAKVEVRFENAGTKKLVLKFANLQIIG